MLYQVKVPHFTCGVVTDDRTNLVVLAAPIMRWAVGKPMSTVAAWVAGKHGSITQCTERHLPQEGYDASPCAGDATKETK